MRSYVSFVVTHKIGFSIGIACLTLLSFISISNAVLSTSLGELFFSNTPEYARYLEISEEFSNDEVLIVAMENVDPLAPSTTKGLRLAAQKLEALPDVRRVQGIHQAQWVRVEDDALIITGFAEEAENTPERQSELLNRVRTDELTRGLLVADKEDHVSIAIEFHPDSDRSAEAGPELVGKIQDILTTHGFPKEGHHLAGSQAMISVLMEESYISLITIFPLSGIMLLLVVFLLFRRVWPGFVAAINTLIAVSWTMGIVCYLNPKLNILMTAVPAVVGVISVSDVIHLCSAYLTELRAGRKKQNAILEACADVGRACLFTSVTTFLGFVGMSFVPTPAFQQLGIALGLGTGIALLLAVTLVPIVLSFLAVPEQKEDLSVWENGVQRILNACSNLSLGYPKRVIAGFGLVTLVLLYGISNLHIETSFESRLDSDHAFSKDIRFFEEHFASARFLPILVHGEEDEGLLDPEAYAGLHALQNELKNHPEVDGTLSLVDLIQTIHVPFHSDDPDATLLPDTRAALAQYLLLFEMSGGEDLDRLVDFRRRSTMVLVRLNDGKFRAAGDLGQWIIERGQALLPSGFQVEPTGQMYMTGSWLDEILEGQKQGLAFTYIAITLVMLFGLRSLRVGFLSMIPNIFPVLFLGGLLGLTMPDVDSDILLIALLAISIGVDDTIHFLMRYRTEALRTHDRNLALQRTFNFAGRGIVITTVTLSLGFMPFLLSNYLSTEMFGTYLPGVLFVALGADLLLVPAMVQMGWLAFEAEGDKG